MRRIALLSLVAIACGSSSSDTSSPPPTTPPSSCPRSDHDDPPPPVRSTARWAFEPWISKDISTRADTYDFVDGFKTRGIPVGAVVLDSPWETFYNTFVPNPPRYGDFPSLVSDMHARGVRIVLWITMMTNETGLDAEPGGDTYVGPAPNLQAGLDCNYFVDDGYIFGWWKGRGAAIDLWNDDARAWWHRQQDIVLGAGIDGWKLDFAESYMREDVVKTKAGPIPFQQYSERYYDDYLAYGRMKRGADFVTMVRAWDKSYDFEGRFFAKKEDAPVAWMGDNRRDYVGLADALDEMFTSAKAGYVVLGSDIGGYLDTDDKALLGPKIPFDTTLFARWVAVGALSPFMQLHGRANLAPWTVPDHVDETVALYKYWATLHHALVPYLFSSSEEAYKGGPVLVRPIGGAGDYRYQLGDAFLVAPLMDASGARSVELPAGVRWFDWWSNDAINGTTASADFSKDTAKIPIYVREGAIVPMNVDSDVLGFVPAKDALTLLVWPSGNSVPFRLHEEDGTVTTITAQPGSITLSAANREVVFRVRAETDPTSVGANGTPLARVADATALVASSFFYDTAKKTIVARVPPQPASLSLAIVP